jgi:hypothetical protein
VIRYRAIVSIEFDDEDLATLAAQLGTDDLDPADAVGGELDSMALGSGWVEQLFRNGRPTIHRLTGDGIQVTVNDHDLDGSEDDCEDDFDEDEDEEY